MVILYLGDYYLSEEHFLQDNNIPCVRLDYPFSHNGNIGVQSGDTVLIRGGKLNTSAYADVAHYFEQHGINCVVSAHDYEKIASAVEYSKCFGKYAPKVLMFDINEPIDSISHALSASELTFPLFVRSDVESAAKYVGFEACVLKSNTHDDIAAVIRPIKDHVANPTKVVMKEIVNTMKINGKNIEYRAIVVAGKIICFDYEANTEIPSPDSLDCYGQFEECVSLAFQNGLSGAYFVDFGINSNGDIFVVECKNVINGTIKSVDSFMKGLKNLQ